MKCGAKPSSSPKFARSSRAWVFCSQGVPKTFFHGRSLNQGREGNSVQQVCSHKQMLGVLCSLPIPSAIRSCRQSATRSAACCLEARCDALVMLPSEVRSSEVLSLGGSWSIRRLICKGCLVPQQLLRGQEGGWGLTSSDIRNCIYPTS